MAGLRECWLGIADLGGCLMGLFLAGSGVLCGLIWLAGKSRNLGYSVRCGGNSLASMGDFYV